MTRKKKSSDGGGNWMDTYGDMVTLLLCFFVLLYSMSSVDEAKLREVILSFNPNAVTTPSQIEQDGNAGPFADPIEDGEPLTEQQIEEVLDSLYVSLKNEVVAQQAGSTVEISKGDGFVFISFNDAVFFGGDSYVLLDEGREILGKVSTILGNARNAIDEVRVMGHTAQAREDRPNSVQTDRYLASNRATVATIYLQEHSGLDPARLVSMGYGQWRPISENTNSESRKKNRRVEIIITGRNLASHLGDSVEQYYAQRDGAAAVPEIPAP